MSGMRVAIISDSHDNLHLLEKAVSLITQEGIELVLHAGDFVSPFTARMWEKYKGKFTGVFGNNDGDRATLKNRYSEIGSLHEGGYTFVLEKRIIHIVHELQNRSELEEAQIFDLVVYGHTHRYEMKQTGKTLFLNPGELCGWLTGKASMAIWSSDDNSAEFRWL